jgi:hypothetical protein
VSQLRARARRAEARRFLAIANALPKVRAVRAEYPRAFEVLRDLPSGNRQVLYYQPEGNLPPKEIGEVVIDGRSGRVLEAWTGFQLEWELARGYPGFLGRHVNALYIWLPLCILFLLPFVNFRRPLSLLHLDLLMLLSFSVSLAFFNHVHIYASVRLAYPPLIYLLARMLVLARPGRPLPSVPDVASESEGAAAAGAPALVPARSRSGSQRLMLRTPWLVLGIVLLTGFRIALNVTDSNVLDAGQAGVIGAQRIVKGEPLYGSYPAGHSDTYGPVNYEAYIPFERLFGRKGTSAAHAAAIVFDLLSVVMMFLLGRRVRGPALGIALAYAWVSYPFTLYVLETNSNDALVAVLVLAALLAATCRSKIGQTTRGAFTALAGLTKFAPLALAPLLATHGLGALAPGRPRALALFLGGFVGAVALVFIPVLSHDSLQTIYEQTIAFQANRTSPFSVWGLYGGLGGLQLTVQILVVLLAFAVGVLPRRPDLIGLAAASAAVVIATQLGIKHWLYTYIPWFFPLAMLALLGHFRVTAGPGAGDATPARSAKDDRELVDREELDGRVVRTA